MKSLKKKTEKPKLVRIDLDKQITELVGKADHKTLAIWAADCAERVLPYFEGKYPKDDRPRRAIESCREWTRTGVFRMADVRRVALAAHAAAREAEAGENNAARSAARAAGQAAATPHVPRHSVGAAVYAATAVRDGVEATDADTAVSQERNWQYHHLLELQ